MTAAPIRKIIFYFKLRPVLSWSVFSMALMLIILFTIRWNKTDNTEDYLCLKKFQMIEVSIKKSNSQPEISTSKEQADISPEQNYEKNKFGNNNGDFTDLDESSTPPRPLFRSLPDYPESMRQQGTEGVVEIEIGIDENGKIVYGVIHKSIGEKFDIAVINWAKQISFYPALTPEGLPFKCSIILPVRFKLEQ